MPHVYRYPQKSEEGAISLRTGVINSCELPGGIARDKTQVLSENSRCYGTLSPVPGGNESYLSLAGFCWMTAQDERKTEVTV